MRRVVNLLAVLLLSGCAEDQVNTFRATPDTGLVVVSTRFDSPCGIGSNLLLDKDADNSVQLMMFKNPFLKYNAPEHDGFLWARAYRAGHWRVDTIRVGNRIASDKQAWSFDVKPGQAVYIGEVTLHVNGDCSLAAITVKDEWARDSAVLPRLFPGIAASEVQKQLMHH